MRNERGVSLIESILVIAIVGAIILLLANIPPSLGLITKSKHLSLAREIAVKAIEDKRATNYLNLPLGTENLNDPRLSTLPEGTGNITVSECDVLVCTNSEAVKKVTVEITWKSGKQQNLKLDTYIAEGGLNQ